jgi:hypothetical protein
MDCLCQPRFLPGPLVLLVPGDARAKACFSRRDSHDRPAQKHAGRRLGKGVAHACQCTRGRAAVMQERPRVAVHVRPFAYPNGVVLSMAHREHIEPHVVSPKHVHRLPFGQETRDK